MLQSVVRILLLGVLGYGLYRMVPVVQPPLKEVWENSNVSGGAILGATTNYFNKISGNENTVINPDGGSVDGLVNDLIGKARESVVEKVQEDVDDVKEEVKDVANEQFCKTILKTLEKECGQFYCDKEGE